MSRIDQHTMASLTDNVGLLIAVRINFSGMDNGSSWHKADIKPHTDCCQQMTLNGLMHCFWNPELRVSKN